MEPVVALVAFGVCVVPGFALKLCACVDVCQEGFDGVRVLPCGLVVLSGGFVPVLGDDAGAGAVDGDCGGEGIPVAGVFFKVGFLSRRQARVSALDEARFRREAASRKKRELAILAA